MTQISAMLSTAASLIDKSAISSSPAHLFIILAVAALIICAISTFVFERRKNNTLASISFVLGFLTALSLVMTGISYSANSYTESEKTSNTKIAQFIQGKYGVTVLDDQNIGTDIGDHTTLTPVSIPAKAPSGERIQITIELSEDGTDVLAFSSGAEMKKVSK